MPSAAYFAASFGGVDLLVVEITTDGGRDVAVHSPSRGNNHALQDRGQKFESATAELLFIDQPDQTSDHAARFKQFKELVDLGEASVFTHPLLGAYRARISNMQHRLSADERSIAVNCTILPEEEPQLVFPSGSGVAAIAGVDAVSAAADAADAKLAAVGLATDISADAVAAVTAWAASSASDDLDASSVTAAVADISARIGTAVQELELASDLSRWEAYRALILLGFQVRQAGQAATAEVSTFIEVTVGVARPLLALCAEVYGAALAQERAPQVAKLNRVRTPGLVKAGTVLKMPADGAQP